MKPERLRGYDELSPDGVPTVVNWDAMEVGMSIFIPCIKTNVAVTQTRRVFRGEGGN